MPLSHPLLAAALAAMLFTPRRFFDAFGLLISPPPFFDFSLCFSLYSDADCFAADYADADITPLLILRHMLLPLFRRHIFIFRLLSFRYFHCCFTPC